MATMTVTTPAPARTVDQVAQRFPTDIAGHRMTVLDQTATMRRLRFANPTDPEMWFDVVTFPNVLVFTGDMGDFIFRWWGGNNADVLGYFAMPSIGYLASKVVAGRVDEYSPTVAGQMIHDDLAEALADADPDRDGDLIAAITDGSLWDDLRYDVGDESTLRRALDDAHDRFDGRVFADVWEWDLTDYTYRFAWAIRALAHAAAALTAPGPEQSPAPATPAR